MYDLILYLKVTYMNHKRLQYLSAFRKKCPSFVQLNVVGWLLVYAGAAMAQSTGAPWDGPLCGVAGWFRGPTALAVGTIAFAAAAGGFIYGEEFSGIMKKVVNVVMAVSLLIGGASMIGWIATKMGASISGSCS